MTQALDSRLVSRLLTMQALAGASACGDESNDGATAGNGGGAAVPATITGAASAAGAITTPVAGVTGGVTAGGSAAGTTASVAGSGTAGGASAGQSGASSTAGTSAAGSGSAGTPATVPSEKFSFFVASYAAMQRLSKSEAGFGGDLRYGESDGLKGLLRADAVGSARGVRT